MTAVAAAATTRDLIVNTADELFYQRGFDGTSFAGIADRLRISRGNFYHHFKTKDEILAAVIALRRSRTQAMLDDWCGQEPTAIGRLSRFAQMLVANRHQILRLGCPVGSLCSELAKSDHPLLGDAGTVLDQFRQWLRQQFQAAGHVADADALAMHLLARSQGIAVLASTFRDEQFLQREVGAIEAWLRALAPPPSRRGRGAH